MTKKEATALIGKNVKVIAPGRPQYMIVFGKLEEVESTPDGLVLTVNGQKTAPLGKHLEIQEG